MTARTSLRNYISVALMLSGSLLASLLLSAKVYAQPLQDQLQEAGKELVGQLLIALDNPDDATPFEQLFASGADLEPVENDSIGLESFRQRLEAFAGGTHKLRGIEVTQNDSGSEVVITAIIDWQRDNPGEPAETARFGVEIVAIPVNGLSKMAIQAWHEKYLTPSDTLGVKLFC